MKAYLTLLILFFRITCFAQGYNLKDFEEVQPFKYNRNALRTLFNTSGKFFTVGISNGQLTVTDRVYKNTHEFALPYGTVWSVDLGEFSGMLYYQPKDTSVKIIKINGKPDTLQNYAKHPFVILHGKEFDKSRLQNKQFTLHFQYRNVNTFFSYRNGIYFTEGMSHSKPYGEIYNIDIKKNSGTITKVLSIGDAYQSILVKNDMIYLVTYKHFFAFNKWKKEVELTNLHWEGLYPNGLVMIDNNTLYTGLYGGYAKIDLKTQNVTMYRYTRGK